MINKLLLTSILLCTGCPPTSSSAPESELPAPILQPADSIYKLDTIDAFYGGAQSKTAQWINAHPKAEIISMVACHGNGFILVVYKEK